MIKKLILGVLALVVLVVGVLVIVIAMQPAEYAVTRTTKIDAPPSAVFPHVDDFKKWDGWSPWAKIDPNMKVTLSGPPNGVGAKYEWTGNDEVGDGRMSIVESKPSDAIKVNVEFIKPIASTSVSDFTFKPSGTTTDVTWKMSGQKNFMMKAFCLVVDIDKMMGADFEKGLAQLKKVSETPSVQ